MYTLITGATSGIGYELAKVYAHESHDLILVARNEERLNEIKREINHFSKVKVEIIVIDLSVTDALEMQLSKLNDQYSIKHVINNAGIGLFNDVSELNSDAVVKQTQVNLIAPILITRLFLNQIKSNNGSIVFISSILSDLPNKQKSVYVATKHGITGFANTLRLEEKNLHVLTVHPKTVATNFFNDGKVRKKGLNPAYVAKKIYDTHKKKKRRLNIPRIIGLLRLLYLLFPKTIDKMNSRFFTD